MVEFRILGPLEVERDGEPVAVGGQKQRALLALLLLNANRVVSTDRILDALWGDEPPRTAATSLQNFVSALRKAVGPDAVATRPPGYVLRVELELWRGPPLPELAYEAWAQADLAQLEELRLAALEQRVEAELAAGRD